MKPIVLVHGAWHGSWCWDAVTGPLIAAGAPVHTVELPFTGVADDAAAVQAVLGSLDEPAVLVGHSYGGVVINRAAGANRAAHLVYLCAILLADGDDLGARLGDHPPVVLNSAIRFREDGMSFIDPDLAEAAFYARCPPGVAEAAIPRLRPFPLDSVGGPGGPQSIPEPWREAPSTYIVCTQDEAIPWSLQREMAIHATAVEEWDTDHSPFASSPDETVVLLARLASSG